MKRPRRQQTVRDGLDLVEEATHVLRGAPVTVLASYYVGSLPFIFGLLYFWADMSRNPFASRHAVEASLALALLFLWMKFWQVVFARQIRTALSAEPGSAWSLARAARVLVTQAILQPWGLFILPLTLITVVPFPLAYAFFQNVTVLDDGAGLPTWALVRHSGRQAALRPGQNVLAILIMLAFALAVFFNLVSFCYMLPDLVHTFLGIESVFSRGGLALLLNTTFWTTVAALTYLCLDPIVKTTYVLRCYYGESIHSGEDLKARLKQFTSLAKAAALAAGLFLCVAAAGSLKADDSPPSAPETPATTTAPALKPAIPAAELDHSITEVISQSKYTWRMPREKTADADEGVIARFFDQVRTMIRRWLSELWDWVRRTLEKFMPQSSAPGALRSMFAAMTVSQILIFSLVALVACVLAIFIFRYWQNRRRRRPVLASAPLQSIPDLADENTRADQLPEDGWTKLAHELLERGEYRLALRAFYLAGLANLAGRNLISLARFKSNRDYERELRRRGHALPQLPPAFGEMVAIFDRVWYGLHEANRELVTQFTTQVEKLKVTE